MSNFQELTTVSLVGKLRERARLLPPKLRGSRLPQGKPVTTCTLTNKSETILPNITVFKIRRRCNCCTKLHSLYIAPFEEHNLIRIQGLLYVVCKYISVHLACSRQAESVTSFSNSPLEQIRNGKRWCVLFPVTKTVLYQYIFRENKGCFIYNVPHL